MRFNRKLLPYYALVAIAIMGSLVSLFALFELAAPGWTILINALSIVCILLAVKARGHAQVALMGESRAAKSLALRGYLATTSMPPNRSLNPDAPRRRSPSVVALVSLVHWASVDATSALRDSNE